MAIVDLRGNCPKCKTPMVKRDSIENYDELFFENCPICGTQFNMTIHSIEKD